MSEYEYGRSERRRTGTTGERQYQHGGRRSRQWERRGGQTSRWSGRQEQPTGESEYSGQQSRYQSRGTMGRQTGRQATSQRTQQPSQTGGQTAPQMGQPAGQMWGQPTQQGLIPSVTVSDIAARNVVTTTPDAPVTDVTQKMAREDVGSVVVTDGNRPVGIITDRKIALAVGETPNVSRLRATDLMSEDMYTVPEGTNVFELVQQFGDLAVRRLPVVDDRGDLRGIVSLDDVVVLLAEEFGNMAQLIRKQSSRL